MVAGVVRTIARIGASQLVVVRPITGHGLAKPITLAVLVVVARDRTVMV
jgi:hypothetical protein